MHTILYVPHRRQDLPGLRVKQDNTGRSSPKALARLKPWQQVCGNAGSSIRRQYFAVRSCQPAKLSLCSTDSLQLQAVIQAGGNGQTAALRTPCTEIGVKLGQDQFDKSRCHITLS